MFIHIFLNNVKTKNRQTQAWKKIDMKKLKNLLKNLFTFECFNNENQIENYVMKLMK